MVSSAPPTTLELLREIEACTTRSIAAGRDVTAIGAFLAAIHPTKDLTWLNFAIPAGDRASQMLPGDIEELRSLFRSRGRRLRFEYFEALWPDLARSLEEHGLVLEGRMPVMICTPEQFAPVAAPGVRVFELALDADDADYREFLLTVKHGFGVEPLGVEAAEIEEQREYIRAGIYRCAFAVVGRRMVGVGSLTQVNHELAGIATLPEFRRRGVAATVSSYLVQGHLQAGQPAASPRSWPAYVWLSAGDEAAWAVYRKIGFWTAGVQLNYVEPEGVGAGN